MPESGSFTFVIRNNGVAIKDPNTVVVEAEFIIHDLTAPDPESVAMCSSDFPTDFDEFDFTKVKSRCFYTRPTYWNILADTARSFVGGDPETGAGIVASVAGGMAIVGDLGGIVKNLWRGASLSGPSLDKLETGLCTVGLVTEFCLPADAGVGLYRALYRCAKAGGYYDFAEASLLILKKIKGNYVDLYKFSKLGLRMLKNAAFRKATMQGLTSPELVQQGINVCEKEFGDEMAKGIGDFVDENGDIFNNTTRGTIKVLDEVDPQVLSKLKDVGPELAAKAVKGLVTALEAGIDASLIKKALKADLFDGARVATGEVTHYTHAQFLIDLGDVAKLAKTPEALKGLTTLINQMSTVNRARFGFRYTLEVAAFFVREGATSITGIERHVPAIRDDAGLLLYGCTDIDLIVNGVYYQVKRSKAAFKGGEDGVDLWVSKIKEFWKRQKLIGKLVIRYVTPHGIADVPGPALTALQRLGVPVVPVPFS
jgi:hypothetical protein